MEVTVYHMINWFFAYSFFGYLLECTVLSYENKRAVLNRGFGHGPFCIIYGFGAVGAYAILQPISQNTIQLYFASMLMATTMELITANLMIHLFGSFWWDYSRKPYNYKGIICLESCLAWGFLGVFFFRFLDGFMHRVVARIPLEIEKYIAIALVLFYLGDFVYTMRMQIKGSDDDDDTPMVGRLKIY